MQCSIINWFNRVCSILYFSFVYNYDSDKHILFLLIFLALYLIFFLTSCLYIVTILLVYSYQLIYFCDPIMCLIIFLSVFLFFLYLFFYICTSSFLLSFTIRFLLYLLYQFIINNIKVPQLIIHSTVPYDMVLFIISRSFSNSFYIHVFICIYIYFYLSSPIMFPILMEQIHSSSFTHQISCWLGRSDREIK